MKRKLLHRYVFFIGLSLIFISLLLFLFGVGMFTSRGDFPQFIIKISEFCFIFWLPTFVLGAIFCFIGVTWKIYQSNSVKK